MAPPYLPDLIDDYTDYRSFVLEGLARKQRTQADLAQYLGLSTSMVSSILTGKKRLRPSLGPRLAEFFDLRPQQRTLLTAMIDLDNPSPLARRAAWRVIEARQRYLGRTRPTAEEALWGANWVCQVVFELASLPTFQPDPRWIHEVAMPAIPIEVAAEALRLLMRVGALSIDEDGRITQAKNLWFDELISDDDVSVAAEEMHTAWLRESIPLLSDPDGLHISHLLSIGEQQYDEILSTLLERQRSMVSHAVGEGEEQARVYHLSWLFFPLSEYTDCD